MRLAAVIVACLLLLPALGAAEETKLKTEQVTFKSGDDKGSGYLARPEGKGPYPGIIVIQEWYGVNDWVKDNAKRLAGQGYVCLAVDLYRGKVAKDGGAASKMMKGLPRDRALKDLKGGVDFLTKHEAVNKDKIGVIGWCMGGGYALQLALADKRVVACVICYGRVETDPDKLKPLNASVLGVFGKEDKGIPIANVRKFGQALKKAGKTVEEIGEYDGGHGFMREKDDKETKRAYEKIDKYFAKALKGK
jgi:carboxymethylenebutenolidase